MSWRWPPSAWRSSRPSAPVSAAPMRWSVRRRTHCTCTWTTPCSRTHPSTCPCPCSSASRRGCCGTCAARRSAFQPIATAGIDLGEAIARVLRLPTVANKTFLISIGDRSITGQVARDQMVGPWQVPVADCAVTASDYRGVTGEAMAIGERTPVALIDAAASGRMAVGEAITNIAAAAIADLGQVRLSANWMAAAGHPGEDARLYDTVRAVGMELCPALGIAIPVGKDSMSMKTVWSGPQGQRAMTAPLSLIVSAFAPVGDVRRTLTPQLRTDQGETDLILIDLGAGREPPGRVLPGPGLRPVGGRGPGPGRARVGSRTCLPPSRPCATRSSPTTTAPTAACWRPCAKWPSPGAAALRWTWAGWAARTCRRCSARSWGP